MNSHYFTKAQLAALPSIYGTEQVKLEDKIAQVKLFNPWGNWTWYVIEYDGKDLCWGLVHGDEREFGYFSLSELSQIRIVGPVGLHIERDKWFKPCKVADLMS